MKKLLTFFLYIFFSYYAIGQTKEDLKQDSLKLQQLKLQEAIINAQNAVDKAKNTPSVEAANAQQSAKEKELANAKATKELFGDSMPTALTGSITFSDNKNALAETRVLIHKNLDTLIKRYLKDVQDGKCPDLKCNDNKPVNIIVYDEQLYNSVPDYSILMDEMKLIDSSYQLQIKAIKGNILNNVGSTIAVGTSILKTLFNLSTLFRTETDFQINNETIDESTLISKIRAQDTCCNRNYFYPSIYAIPRPKNSPLLSIIFRLDSLKNIVGKEINSYKEKNNKPLIEKKSDLEEQKKQKEVALNSANNQQKPKLQEEIEGVKKKIDSLQNKINSTGKEFQEKQAKTDEVYDKLRDGLMKIDTSSKTSLLKSLLKVEGVLDKLHSNGYTLRITAKGKGTNKIKKFLWRTTLRHSGFVELEYQLFDAKAVLSRANAIYQYSPYTKTRNIK